MEQRATLILGVVVRAVAALDHAETVVQQLQGGAERVGGAALEPAQSAGAPAGEHRATGQRPVEQFVDALPAPDIEHVGGVAASDVDHVGLEDEVGEVVEVLVEQPEVPGTAAPRADAS